MELNDLNICLEPHATARSKAVAKTVFIPGSIILVAQPLTTVLLPIEKKHRCDLCHQRPPDDGRLLKCTGCASHWYCDARCANLAFCNTNTFPNVFFNLGQGVAWRAHHGKICASYFDFIASPAYISLSAEEKMGSLLLSQFSAEMLSSGPPLHQRSSLAIFESLMPSRSPPEQLPPMLVRLKSPNARKQLLDLYSRFGNNNFVLHSHLVSFGHGIYPLASRLFNHSCVPNAAVCYSLTQGSPPSMRVIALRKIAVDEEVCELTDPGSRELILYCSDLHPLSGPRTAPW